jgi:hypothetical protein
MEKWVSRQDYSKGQPTTKNQPLDEPAQASPTYNLSTEL